jgi:hypothetical protein
LVKALSGSLSPTEIKAKPLQRLCRLVDRQMQEAG